MISHSFSLSLPSPWGIPLAWSLSALPLLPLLVGLLAHLVLAGEQYLNHNFLFPIGSNIIPHRWTRGREAPSNFLYSFSQMVLASTS